MPVSRVDLLDLDFDLLADLQHFAGVVDAVPAHLADVDQAIDAAQIDERAEIVQLADGAFADLARRQLGEQLRLVLGRFALDHARWLRTRLRFRGLASVTTQSIFWPTNCCKSSTRYERPG